MHVLIIENNPDLAANVCDFLEAKGHSADTAGDGITGLHLAVTLDYDAIVLDVMLPGMDGFTLCKRLREEARRDTPVLMLTALDALDDRIAGLEFGADDYVVKPFALRAHMHVLRAAVEGAGEPVLRLVSVSSMGQMRVTKSPYRACMGSWLRRRMGSILAWAISSRSKGSWWWRGRSSTAAACSGSTGRNW